MLIELQGLEFCFDFQYIVKVSVCLLCNWCYFCFFLYLLKCKMLYLMLNSVCKQRHVFLWLMVFSVELFRLLELLRFTSFDSLLKINWFKYVLNTSWYLQCNTLKQTCKHGRNDMNHHPKGWVFGHLVGNGSGCWEPKETVWETWVQECFIGT